MKPALSPTTGLKGWWRGRWQRWLDQRIPGSQEVELDHRRIFIMPTKAGLLFVSTALVLFLAGTNFVNNLVLGLCFTLLALFLLAILFTYRNLAGLHLKAGAVAPAFAGQQAHISLHLSAKPKRDHFALWLQWPNSHALPADVPAAQQHSLNLALAVDKRGWYRPGRLWIRSNYPLGLLRAWTWVDLNIQLLVYPQPLPSAAQPQGLGGLGRDNQLGPQGSDDFTGLRAYQAGDSLQQVDWKALARNQTLHTKLFKDPQSDEIWLDWQQFAGLDVESRLSHLCYWVLELGRENLSFGLRLPKQSFAPDRGPRHQAQLLEALALF